MYPWLEWTTHKEKYQYVVVNTSPFNQINPFTILLLRSGMPDACFQNVFNKCLNLLYTTAVSVID